MNLETWLHRGLAHQPLKDPAPVDRARYTAEVMARVKSIEQSASAPAPHRVWWIRPAFVAMTATAALVFLIGRVGQAPVTVQVVSELEDAQRLAAGEGVSSIEPIAPPAELAQDVGVSEPLIVAESFSEEEQWLEDTLKLLEQFDEELPEDVFEDWSDEDWLEELQMLDDELFAGS